MARDTLLSYPGFKEELNIHTNAGSFQLVAVIIQNGKLIAFYGIKMAYDQKKVYSNGKGAVKHF